MAVGMVPAAPTGKPAQETSSAAFSQAPVLGERSSGLSSCSHASSSFQSGGAKQPSSLTSAEANTVQGRELSSTSTATYQEKRGVWAISMICFPCRDVLTKAVLLSHAAVGKEKALPQRGTQSLEGIAAGISAGLGQAGRAAAQLNRTWGSQWCQTQELAVCSRCKPHKTHGRQP